MVLAKKLKKAPVSKGKTKEGGAASWNLPIGQSVLCPVDLLRLDVGNPRLQTGEDIDVKSEKEAIEALVEIAAIDELVTSICTNRYLNLEPMIVYGSKAEGPFIVLEGNRRLAAIRLITNRPLAAELGIRIPTKVSQGVLDSFKQVLVNRVAKPEDAREFIGFKHINGPQRWDAYAKARYVTDWYKSSDGKLTIDDIAAKMGDNNNTLRSYIYAVLMLDQAEKAGTWSMADRPPTRGRFGFSHLYTAISRDEYQEFLGIKGKWSDKPPLDVVARGKIKNLGEVLTYLYGSVSDGRTSLIKSQNPDLKDIGLALAHEKAHAVLRARGDLDAARDEMKTPTDAFYDALVAASLRLSKALNLLAKYSGKNSRVNELVSEIFENAETLKLMIERKHARGVQRAN